MHSNTQVVLDFDNAKAIPVDIWEILLENCENHTEVLYMFENIE